MHGWGSWLCAAFTSTYTFLKQRYGLDRKTSSNTKCFILVSAAGISIRLFKLMAMARRHGAFLNRIWSTVSSLILHIETAPLDERHSCVQYAQVHIPFLIRSIGSKRKTSIDTTYRFSCFLPTPIKSGSVFINELLWPGGRRPFVNC